jgi:hypothetical protein
VSTAFFQKPTPINRDRHSGVKLDGNGANFNFAANISSMVVAAAEMEAAALSYPLVFIGPEAEKGPTAVTALVGLHQDENVFVTDGEWEEGCYMPAFVRRYPFVLAEGSPDGQLTVCVDEAHPGLNKETGEPLLKDDGEPTEFMQGAIDFLGQCHEEMVRTTRFVQRMHELGLLMERTIEVTRNGETYRLEGLYIIDREKLGAVDDTVAVELFRTGATLLIDAHLISLNNVERLAMRMDRRHAAKTDAAA